MDFVLASASPRRRELFGLMGFPFTAIATDIDESAYPGELPRDYVLRLSQEKARAAASDGPRDTITIACDTTVADGDSILGKPTNAADARVILERLRDRIHTVYTAVTILDNRSQRLISTVATSPVKMRPYSNREVSDYIASGDPFDKAGAYAIQHEGFHPAEEFRHCFANVMGLPLCHITVLLKEIDIQPEQDIPTACQKYLDYSCPIYRQILTGTDK
jgi:MAF protein